jgi:3-hydroxyacyl-CoA dehydrogenase
MADQHLGVVGAGTMGSGIAQPAAQQGLTVTLQDIEESEVEAGLERIRDGLAEAAERDIVDDPDGVFDAVEGTTDIEVVTDGPTFIIEAVPEDMELKRNVFEQLDANTDADTVLATNTSSLPVTEIASATDEPQRTIWTHFFNPPVKMELLEIVTGHHTSAATLERTEALAHALGRTSIVVDDFRALPPPDSASCWGWKPPEWCRRVSRPLKTSTLG